MNLGSIRSEALQRLDEDPTLAQSGSWTAPEVNAAINEGLQFIVFLTLCLEKTATFTLQANTVFYDPFVQFGDWIVPLRVRAAGVKLRPSRIAELDALDSTWRNTNAKTLQRYGTLGWSLLYFYPLSAKDGATADVTYAYSPAPLVNDVDVPPIPEQHHAALSDYAVYHLRQKLGGLEFQKGLEFFGRFLESAKQLGAFTRARSIGQRYDTLPIELTKLDLSRLLKLRKDLLPVQEKSSGS